MTEKDYLRQLGAYDDIQSESYMRLCHEALRLAKQQGAVFDPEPVRLPPLKSTGKDDNQISMIVSQSEPKALKKSQCDEIIRRCKAVEVLRKQAAANKYNGISSLSVDYILKVIDTGSEL